MSNKRKRIVVKSAKMVGSSNRIRARIANRFEINRTYIQTLAGVVVLTQDIL